MILIDINVIAIDNAMTSINSVNSSMIPETIYNNTDDTDLTLVPTNNTPSHQSYDASFNEDNNDNVYLGVEKSAENDQSDSNDDSESQSIDMNATTIDNDASDNVATRTRSRVRLRAKAREERARLEKARKRLQRIPGRNLESVESSSNSPSYEY